MTVIVAIDGPSGVGKSTTSRLVARELQIPHIDTGAMYRALALKVRRNGIDLTDHIALAQTARGAQIEFDRDGDSVRVMLDGEDVTGLIRTADISMAASTISAVPEVRRVLVELQQKLGQERGGVLEGRDIGTKVFPQTPFKFFLTARPDVRADRRLKELEAKGERAEHGTVLDDINRRDRQDSTRADSPLSYDDSYTVVDTSELSIDQVVATIVEAVRSRIDASSP